MTFGSALKLRRQRLPLGFTSPTVVLRTGNQFQVQVFPDSGSAFALDSLTETVSFVRLFPGQYHFTVALFPGRPVGWGTRFVEGNFTVGTSATPDLFQFGVSTRFTPAWVHPEENVRIRWLVNNNLIVTIGGSRPLWQFGPAVGPWQEAVFLTSGTNRVLLGMATFTGSLAPGEGREFIEHFHVPRNPSPGLYRVEVWSSWRIQTASFFTLTLAETSRSVFIALGFSNDCSA